jgi:HAD superfamily hydrolase (TIGR01509 family)
MTRRGGRPFDDLQAISFDFGNTLVPFPSGPMAQVVRLTAEGCAELAGGDVDGFVRSWGTERLRQFAEDVPEGREADMDVRARRVLATLRGVDPPRDGARWDDAALASVVSDEEISAALEAYADAFVALTPVPPSIGPMLERLAERYRLGITSNWPLSLAVERYVERAGWAAHLRAVVVSHRVGAIKPHPRIFEVAAAELGVPSGPSIIHVGDDPGADVVGPSALGWRTAWVTLKPEDSTLPVAPPAPEARPDVTIDTVLDLERVLER